MPIYKYRCLRCRLKFERKQSFSDTSEVRCPKCDGEIEYAQACFHVRAMNDEFRVVPHSMLLGKQMVEFWRDGQFVAGIYPHEDGIRIVSKYLDGVEHEVGMPSWKSEIIAFTKTHILLLKAIAGSGGDGKDVMLTG